MPSIGSRNSGTGRSSENWVLLLFCLKNLWSLWRPLSKVTHPEQGPNIHLSAGPGSYLRRQFGFSASNNKTYLFVGFILFQSKSKSTFKTTTYVAGLIGRWLSIQGHNWNSIGVGGASHFTNILLRLFLEVTQSKNWRLKSWPRINVANAWKQPNLVDHFIVKFTTDFELML